MPYPRVRDVIKDLEYKSQRSRDSNAWGRLQTLNIQPPDAETLHRRSNQYRFRFGKKQSTDRVIQTIIQVIREIRKGDMNFAIANIWPHATDDTPPLRPIPQSGPNIPTKLYTFTQDYEEIPLTVHVSVIAGPGPLTAERIHVRPRYRVHSMSIKDWLLTLPNPNQVPQMSPITATRKWWKLNGQVFRLMDLPAELRLMVHVQVLGPELYPLSTAKWSVPGDPYCLDSLHDANIRRNARIVFGVGWSTQLMGTYPFDILNPVSPSYDCNELRPAVSPPNLSILRVNKQTRKEAIQAGWENTRKHFVNSTMFTLVADARLGYAVNYNCLGNIRLNFTNADYFKFFGVQVTPFFFKDDALSQGSSLSRLPNLVDLQMGFRNPQDGYVGSPWGNIGWNTAFGHCACQRTMVDWIMTFAYPFINQVKKVTLAGYVKKPTKDKWEYILHKAYEGRISGYDQEAEMKTIFKTQQQDLPPACACRTSCMVPLRERTHEETSYGFETSDTFDYEDGNEVNVIENLELAWGSPATGGIPRVASELAIYGPKLTYAEMLRKSLKR